LIQVPYINLIKKYKSIRQNIKINIISSSMSHSFFLPFILSKLDLNPPKDVTLVSDYALGVFILSLIVFFCFINVSGYFIVQYYIKKYDIEDKYPKFKKMIKYYERMSLFSIAIELSLGLVSLLIIICGSFIIAGIPFFFF